MGVVWCVVYDLLGWVGFSGGGGERKRGRGEEREDGKEFWGWMDWGLIFCGKGNGFGGKGDESESESDDDDDDDDQKKNLKSEEYEGEEWRDVWIQTLRGGRVEIDYLVEKREGKAYD
ncbi:uncharacterized protein EAE97_005462 [Botrytis byssoidea]|uniref:Uncharacterized protein n=1 Tax=Botrytis byssoidea TaxID=139641 RepID=A0A9P5IR21_9HELO|nr:uncharacterized protein EAE97_005462 [Botrytis byssoidea]KAF7944829.1 hypothetical protein EAE97_005462 [Botrytis byssoidea]